MTSSIRECAIFGHFADPRVAESLGTVLQHLSSRAVRVLACEPVGAIPEAATVEVVTEEQLAERAELVISIGGDGTLLYAARLVRKRQVPLLGINRGRLGFLTDVVPLDIVRSVDAALDGGCEIDQRPLLSALLEAPDGTPVDGLALNDVVIQKVASGSMMDFEMRINGRYVNTHSSDGVVIASATGSTAYALSCGGPIVEPSLDVVVIAPICPHTLSDRPIVVSARSSIEIRLLERHDSRGQVVCDGQVTGDVAPGHIIRVKVAQEAVTLLHPPGYDYFRSLRAKLRWGRSEDDRLR